MAQLQWLGKEEVLNHHKDISYHTLDTLYTYPKNIKSNTIESKIIKGDNLLALKSLLPMYANKIQCIYIDPPYNTGSENWIYNDNVNSPLMQKWLSKVVNRDDLTRHDKWLCMMYPRLRLLHELLSENGVIFISIDDNEMAHLKLICDEIFGERNFVANLIWEKKTGSSDAKHIATITEYILVYAKSLPLATFNHNRSSYDTKRYKLSDEFEKERGKYYIDNLDRGGLQYSDSLNFAIKCPDGSFTYPNGRKEFVNDGWIWKWSKKKVEWAIENNFLEFRKSTTKASRWAVCYKNYMNVDNENNPIERASPHKSLIQGVLNTHATKEIQTIFNNKAFETPKPIELIKHLLQIATNKDSIILDSFAGSGTTAHAVLELNKQDNGNRKFILIECEDYADSITAQRVKHTINGYGKEPNLNATGGEFSFLEIGEPVLLDKKGEKVLNENLKLEKILEYIFYTEFDTTLCYNKEAFKQNYFVGEHRQKALYFIYEKHAPTTLNLEFIPHLRKQDSYLIYADKCTLSKEQLDQHNIEFKQIPRDIKDL